MAKTLLEAKGLSFSFEYELFSNIDLSINPQQSIAIVGVSGSGKSTLLHNLSSFLKPKSGNVTINEIDIYSSDITQLRRKDIGIIFQFHYLFKSMSGLDNIKVATLLSQQEFDPNLLKELDVLEVIQQQVTELSGGQQQRVSIARVLSKKPKIIFADEPTGNLDKETASKVMQTLINYTKTNNAGLFIVTHDRELAQMCDNIYELKQKQLHQLK